MSVEISTPIVREPPRRPSSRADGGGRQRPFGLRALDDADAVYAYAIDLMAAVEQEIGDLWRDTIDSGDAELSDSLVDLSHAVRRAALAFENVPTIGRAPLSQTVQRSPARSSPDGAF